MRHSSPPPPGPLRVLLAEDSATDAKLVIAEIRRAGHVVDFERVQTADTFRKALETGKWNVLLSDSAMPQFSAMAALSIVNEMKIDVPFIIVTGLVGEDLAVDAMRAGAHDYVLKDKLARLAPAIERELREYAMRHERKRALEALRVSEARFSRLFESGIIGTVVGDDGGLLLEANDAFLRMVGYSRGELSAGEMRWRDLVAPEYMEATDRGLQELKLHGSSSAYEKEYVRKDGTRIHVLAGFASLGGNCSIGFIVDLTAQKRAERALERMTAQLRQAQKMEAVGRLAGGVAHDLNNILSVILSYSATIAFDLPDGDPLRADIEEIGEAGKRAAVLTKQLLTFSQQEIVEPRILDLNEILTSMDKMLRRILGEKVELRATLAASICKIRVDEGQVEQIVMNLVLNARDAMVKGGRLTIDVASVYLDEEYAREHHGVTPGAHVQLTVSDSGTGMDAATLARIFDPFFTTKEKGKGTGLGLSTVFGIVQQSGGSITVDSEVGRGSTFSVYFPAVDEELDPPRSVQTPHSRGGTETILLVENDDRVRAAAVTILKKREYRVLEASNGGEALLHCESFDGEIHLLLSDVIMPQMSGPELAKRAHKLRPTMKILCMSGYTDDALGRDGDAETKIEFLQKPFTPTTLAKKVRTVLDLG